MKNIFYTLLSALFILSCGDSKNNSKSNTNTNVKTTACLQNFDYQYHKLLTKADISKYINIDEPSYKMDISSTKGKYGSCVYSWDSERPEKEITSKATGMVYKRPDKNQVTIKLLDFYTDEDLERNKQESVPDLFDQGYKKLSQTEYDELLTNFEKKLGDNPKELAQAKKMLKNRMKFTYKPVDNLGDRAYWKWTDYGVELVVLTGNAKFTILSKTSGKPQTSLEDAIKFAKEVLAKCEL